MNIVLSQKDADFILKYIRMDARRVEERYQTLKENEQNLIESYKKANFNDSKVAETIMGITKEISDNVKDDLLELQKDFSRCIELLTVGSEVTE